MNPGFWYARKPILASVLCLGLLALLAACGGEERQDPPGEQSGAELGDGAVNTEETGSEANEPVEPFRPIIVPLEEAQSVFADLEETTSGESASLEDGDQYEADQYGVGAATAERRTVPAGQTLAAGAEDESDGPLKRYRLVAYYGTPLSELMGVLGEYEPEEMMERLNEQARAYSVADPERPAVPTIELIASIAQRDPGPDGLYVSQTPPEVIEEYARLAEENGALLILDVQLGRATVMEEMEVLRPFLERPYVHLAIDTEYSVEDGQVPGQDLGTVDGSEIAEAAQYLDRMVEEKNLPDKILMVHQFESGIVTNKEFIEPTANVEVVLHADGFGAPEDKIAKYRTLVRDEAIQYGGFKLFYTQDSRVMTPEEVLMLDPAPAVVTYQ